MIATLAAVCSSGGKKQAASTVTAVSSTTTTRPSARCRTPELAPAGPTGSNGATGHQITYFQLKNASQRSCQLLGYPGVTLADGAGSPIPTKDQRGGGFIIGVDPPRAVQLAPGGTAAFGLETHSCVAGDDRPGTMSASIQVIPPDETDHLTIPAQLALCQDQTLIVSPIRATPDEIARHG
jgi:hypothetical protein